MHTAQTKPGTYIRTYVCMYVQYVCMYVCMYVCIYACMYVQYVCMFVCVYVHTVCSSTHVVRCQECLLTQHHIHGFVGGCTVQHTTVAQRPPQAKLVLSVVLGKGICQVGSSHTLTSTCKKKRVTSNYSNPLIQCNIQYTINPSSAFILATVSEDV